MTTYPAPMPWILPACANGPQIGQMAITVALSARINSRYRARNLCLSQPIPPTETLPLNPLFRLRLQSPNWQWKPSCAYHRLIFANFIPAFYSTFYDHLIGHVKTQMKFPAVKYLQNLLRQYKKDWAIIRCHSRCNSALFGQTVFTLIRGEIECTTYIRFLNATLAYWHLDCLDMYWSDTFLWEQK